MEAFLEESSQDYYGGRRNIFHVLESLIKSEEKYNLQFLGKYREIIVVTTFNN